MASYTQLKEHIGHSIALRNAETPDTGIVLHCLSCKDDIEHIQRPKPMLSIIRDSDSSMDPRTDHDHLSVMACWHGRYILGDVQPREKPDDWLEENAPKGSVVLPVFMYDHGGISLSTSSFGDRWDSGKLGFIVMTPDKILEGWGRDSKEITDETRTAVRECMEEEIKLYNSYLNGDVWGFVYRDENGNKSSCFGFIGSDKEYIRDSILDHCPEAKDLFDEAWEKRS